MKLSVKISIYFSLFALLLGAAAIMTSYALVTRQLENAEKKWVSTLSAALAEPLSVDVINRNIVHAQQTISRIARTAQQIDYIYIIGFDGRVFAHTFNNGFPRGLAGIDTHKKGSSIRNVLFDGEREILEVSSPLIDGMRADLHIGIDPEPRRRAVVDAQILIVEVLAALALAGAIFSLFIGRAVAKPITAIAHHMGEFGKGRLEGTLEMSSTGAEVGQLVDSFNKMISERRNAEENLRKSEGRLRHAEMIARMGHYALDQDGGNLLWSQGLKAMWGFAPDSYPQFDDLVGRLHPEDSGRVMEAFSHAVQELKGFDLEYRVLRPDGKVISVRSVAEVSTGAEGGQPRYFGTIVDITEYKLAQEALKDSQQFLRTVFDAIPSRIIVRDREGRLTMVNQAHVEGLGITPEEYVASPEQYPLLIEEDANMIQAAYRRVIESGEVSSEESLFRWKAGGENYYHTMRVPMKNIRGEVTGVIAVHQDITERKRVEEERRESEAQLQQVFDSIPHTVILKDIDGRYLRVNRAACAFWNLTSEQMVGKLSAELPGRTAEEKDTINSSDNEVLAGGRDIHWFQQTLTDVLGEPRKFQTAKAAIRNRAGEVIGLVAVGLDVTEQMRAEEDLRASQRLLQTVFDTIPVGVFVKDRKGSTIMVNKAHADGLNRSPDDFENKSNEELNVGTPEEMARMIELDRLVLETGETMDIPEDSLTLPNGEMTWWHVVKTPLKDDSGDIIGLVGMRDDITERKKIDLMKQEFISVVSHELRTPLTSIMGAVGLVLGGVAGNLSGKAEEMLNIANSNAQRLLHLINDILDLEKIESGKMDLVMESVDVTTLAEEAVRDNTPYAEKYGIRLALNNSASRTLIQGSREGLLQVLANLLSNAAKFSPPGGVVELSVHRLESHVRFAVIDQGPGVPIEAQESIFEKFTQADSSDTRSKDGTGLGLSIARAIIQQHAGEISLESTPGQGCKFYFDLPFPSASDGQGINPAVTKMPNSS